MSKMISSKYLLLFSAVANLWTGTGCQTTRLPKAVRSADNKSLVVQVSSDSSSLLWNGRNRSDAKTAARINRSLSSSGDTAFLQMNAELLLVGGMTKPAAEKARAILRRDMRNTAALKTLIKSAFIERKPHEVIYLCRMAQEYSSQDAELLSLEGLAQFQLENGVSAKILWTRALALDPVHIPTLMNMGVFMLNNGHFKRAGAHFDKVLALQPAHADALTGRALVWAAEGRFAEATAALEDVLSENGDSAFVLLLQSKIAKDRLKDYKLASRSIERLLALRSNDRRTFEQAVVMKQELKQLKDTGGEKYSDEKLLQMAEHSPAERSEPARELTAARPEKRDDELHQLEESLK